MVVALEKKGLVPFRKKEFKVDMTSKVVHGGVSNDDDHVIAKIVKTSIENGSVCFIRLNRNKGEESEKNGPDSSDFNSVDIFDFTEEFSSFFDDYKKKIGKSLNSDAFSNLVRILMDKSYSVVDFYCDLVKVSNPDYNVKDENPLSRLCFVSIGFASYGMKHFKMPIHKRAIRMLAQKFSDGYMEYSDNFFFNIEDGNNLTENDGPLTLVGVPFYTVETVKKDEVEKMLVSNNKTPNELVAGKSVFTDPVSDVLGSSNVPGVSKSGGIDFTGTRKRVSRNKASGISPEAKQKVLDRASQANLIKENLDAIRKRSPVNKSRYFVCDPTQLDDVQKGNSSMTPSLNDPEMEIGARKRVTPRVGPSIPVSTPTVHDVLPPVENHVVDTNDEVKVKLKRGGVFGNVYMRYTSTPHSVTQMRQIDLTDVFEKLCEISDKEDERFVHYTNNRNVFPQNVFMHVIVNDIIKDGAIKVLSPVINKSLSTLSVSLFADLQRVVENAGFVFDYQNTSIELSINSESLVSYCKTKCKFDNKSLSKLKSVLSVYGDYI